jgi:hypothetical protein
MASSEVGDELSLRPNGTTRVILRGQGSTLRVCTIGHYRKLKELWADVIKQQADFREPKVAEARAAYTKEHKTEPPEGWLPEFTAEENSEYDMMLRESMAIWALEVFRMLGDKEPPALDDLPVWMGNAFFASKLFAHWLNVPLVPSSP